MSEKAVEKRYVGAKEIRNYGIANGGQVFGYNLVTTYMSFFFVSVFGIPSTAVALMFLLVGIWDTLNDPLMGSIIDKTRTRYGKLRPYLLAVPIPLAIAIILLFSGPVIMANAAMVWKTVFMVVSYVVWEFFYTIGDVPFWGMSAAISPSPADRTRAISSARFISAIIGVFASFGMSILIDLSNSGVIALSLAQVFMIMGIVAGVGGMALFSLAGLKTRERVVQSIKEPKISDSFKYLAKNKPLLLIVISNALKTFSRVAAVFGNYYYISVLGFASLGILAGIPGLLSGFLMYLFIPKLKKFGNNKQIFIVNHIFRALIISLAFFIGMNHYSNAMIIIPIMAIQSFFISASDSVDMVIPTEMLGDTVDYMEWKTGNRSEGMTFSVLTFVGKFTGSISTAIGIAILPLIGFVVQNDVVLKGANTDFWLWAFFTIIPAVTGLLQIVPYFFYDLVGEKKKMIEDEMRIRREKVSKEMSKVEEEN